MATDNNTLFVRGPSSLTRLGLLGLLSLVLMTADHRLNYLESVRFALSLFIYPLQLAAEFPSAAYDWGAENFASRQHLLEENQTLRESHLLLEARMQRFAAMEAENKRLHAMLQSTTHVDADLLVAEILSVDMDPYRHTVVVNKGRSDKLYQGQPAIDARGVLGQLIHVGPYSATLMLITDPSHGLPVQINRTGERTIAIGSGDLQRLELPHLPSNADIQQGDLLMTSGLGGRFPAGYPVGVIQSIQHDPGEPFSRVTAVPTAQLSRTREALLLWPNNDEARAALAAYAAEDAPTQAVDPATPDSDADATKATDPGAPDTASTPPNPVEALTEEAAQ